MTKASRLRKVLAIGVAAMLGAVSSPAGEIAGPPRDDWSVLSNLVPQSIVTIKPHKGRGKKLRGEFLSSDAESIIVRNGDGQEVAVSREDVKRVLVRRSRGSRAPWYGAAVGAGTGAGLAAAAFAGSGESGEAAPFVIGTAVVLAGVGALGGLLVQRFSRDRLVYQSPTVESPFQTETRREDAPSSLTPLRTCGYDEGVPVQAMSSKTSVHAAELTVLDQIVVRKRAELLAEQSLVPIEELEEAPRFERRSFREALEMRRPAVIAEIKKASPSAGVISEQFDPAVIAGGYEAGGAAALSVLTDKQFFQGSLEHLEQARAAVALPVLRKDFTLDRYHLVQAAAAGADAILLIVAALSDYDLTELLAQARQLDLDALVEVHNEPELERALAAGADIIGVNNRNLKTLEVSLETSFQLAEQMPDDVLRVSESGIRTSADIQRLLAAGYQAFLVGESLMRQAEPGGALASLIEGTGDLGS